MVGIVEFKNPVSFKNGYIGEVMLPLGKFVAVQITDAGKDWQVYGDNGNPKLKTMSRKEFRRIFNITHIKTIVGYDYESYKRRALFNKYLLIIMKWLKLA